jgi:hypothetical protein
MMRTGVLLLAAAQLVLGCATPIDVPPNPAVSPRAHYGRVDVRAAIAEPQANLAAVLRTKGQAAGACCGAAFMIMLSSA